MVKFQQLQVKAAVVVDMGLSGVLDKIIERRNFANDILSRVGCGDTTNLVAYINKLGSLQTLTTTFISSFNSFKSTSETIFSYFDINAYYSVKENFKVTPAIDNFLSQYEEVENTSKNLISNLNPVVTSFEPIPFLNNLSNFTSTIHDMH